MRGYAFVTLNLHRYDNAAVIGVHAANAAGVHDQAIRKLYLIRKKLFDGLGAVRCITMGDHQCAVFGVSDFLLNDLCHSAECFLHADTLSSLYDISFVSCHNGLNA